MVSKNVLVKSVVAVFVTGAFVVGTMAYAKGKPQPNDCPRDIQCTDQFDPVFCDGGVMYPNACYAYADCATGCSSGGI